MEGHGFFGELSGEGAQAFASLSSPWPIATVLLAWLSMTSVIFPAMDASMTGFGVGVGKSGLSICALPARINLAQNARQRSCRRLR